MRDLNIVERAVAAVSPEWGLRRLSAKVALDQHRDLVRNFDGARRDRRTASWRATGGSASAELGPALDILRKRSRDLIRNNEWARNARSKLTAHIIGTGFAVRPDETTKRNKAQASKLWEAFAENCDPQGLTDFGGTQARQVGEVIESGACFVRWYLRPPEFGLAVPLQCEVLEHEHLDSNKTEIRGENVIVHGVEFDRFGRRVAYWLFPQHPGDISMIQRQRWQSERIPATECDHIFRVERPGQVTGVPWLAPAMLRLRDLADYEEAELIRKKIEACFTVFVRRTGNGAMNISQAGDQKKDDAGRRLEKIAPGLIAHLGQDEDISTAAPVASSGAAEHSKQQLRATAAGLGLTYEQVTGDLSGVNFSSIREGKLDFRTTLDQLQYHMVLPQSCRPAWRRFLAAAAGRNGLPLDIKGVWTPPKRDWVDPLKDVKAEGIELALGLDTWSEKVAARGYDPEKHLETLIAEREKLAKAGISFAQGPGDHEPEEADNANTKP